jgi:hypothetical protein
MTYHKRRKTRTKTEENRMAEQQQPKTLQEAIQYFSDEQVSRTRSQFFPVELRANSGRP